MTLPAYIVLAGVVPDANLLLNVVTVALVGIFAVPVLRSRRKDGIIATLEQDVQARGARITTLIAARDELGEKLDAERDRRHEAEKEREACQAAYDTVKQFTAQPVLERLEIALARRDEQLIAHLARLEQLMGAAFIQGEIRGTDLEPKEKK